MGAAQQCGECGSPLRPCKCDRARLKREKDSGRRSTLRPGTYRPGRHKTPGARRRARQRKRTDWERAYCSLERVAFVSSLGCCACKRRPYQAKIENHHVWNEGTSRKGPWWAIVPLCRRCHRRYHVVGKLSLLQQSQPLRISHPSNRKVASEFDQWEAAAAHVEDLWQQHLNGRG